MSTRITGIYIYSKGILLQLCTWLIELVLGDNIYRNEPKIILLVFDEKCIQARKEFEKKT